MQGLVPSLGTLSGHVGLHRALIPAAFALTQPLQLFFASGLALGIPLGVPPGKSTTPDTDGAALIAAAPFYRPSWEPWLQGQRYGASVVGVSSSAATSLNASPFFLHRLLPFLSLSLSLSLFGLGPQAVLIS